MNRFYHFQDQEHIEQEFDVLTRNSGKTSDELFVKNRPASDYSGLSYIKSVSLVYKLRETRVFTGFKRYNSNALKTAAISLNPQSWLPAVKNHGEGIMVEFNQSLPSKQAISKILDKQCIFHRNVL